MSGPRPSVSGPPADPARWPQGEAPAVGGGSGRECVKRAGLDIEKPRRKASLESEKNNLEDDSDFKHPLSFATSKNPNLKEHPPKRNKKKHDLKRLGFSADCKDSPPSSPPKARHRDVERSPPREARTGRRAQARRAVGFYEREKTHQKRWNF